MALCLAKEKPENGLGNKIKRKRKRKPSVKRMSSSPNAEKEKNEGIDNKRKRKKKPGTLRSFYMRTYFPRHSAKNRGRQDKYRTEWMFHSFSKRADRGEGLKIDIPISGVHLLRKKFWLKEQFIVFLRSKRCRVYKLRVLKNDFWDKKPYEKDFEELKMIDGGAFGKVYKVKKRIENVEYAVKKVPFSCEDINPSVLEVLKEVKILSQLPHKHVVGYKAAWIESASGNAADFSDSSSEVYSEPTQESESNLKSRNSKMAVLYIQMELCEGSLKSWLDDRNFANQPVDVKKSTEIFEQIVKGVSYIHSKELMHRDLKPQNILFDFKGRIKIGDFGLGKAFNGNKRLMEPFVPRGSQHSSSKHTKEVGTAPYRAPEVATETNYNFKVDMYSLGVILLELFYPFKSGMERCKVLENLKQSRLPQDFVEKYPEQAKMILKLTASDHNLRPNATEVLKSNLFLSKPCTLDKIEIQGQTKESLSVGGKNISGNAKSEIRASKPRVGSSPSFEVPLHSNSPSASKFNIPCQAKSASVIKRSKYRKWNHENESNLKPSGDKVTKLFAKLREYMRSEGV